MPEKETPAPLFWSALAWLAWQRFGPSPVIRYRVSHTLPRVA